MMSLFRDKYGTEMHPQILLELLDSLTRLKQRQDIHLVYSIATTGVASPTSAFRVRLIRCLADLGMVAEAVQYSTGMRFFL